MPSKSAARGSVSMQNDLSVAGKENNVSCGCALQHPRATKSGENVSQECILHFWEAKEAESVTEG